MVDPNIDQPPPIRPRFIFRKEGSTLTFKAITGLPWQRLSDRLPGQLQSVPSVLRRLILSFSIQVDINDVDELNHEDDNRPQKAKGTKGSRLMPVRISGCWFYPPSDGQGLDPDVAPIVNQPILVIIHQYTDGSLAYFLIFSGEQTMRPKADAPPWLARQLADYGEFRNWDGVFGIY